RSLRHQAALDGASKAKACCCLDFFQCLLLDTFRLAVVPIERAAFPGRESIAIDHHDVDVSRASGHTVSQDQLGLVDDRAQRAAADLVGAEWSPRSGGVFCDEGLDRGIGLAAAFFVVSVPAGVGLST